MSENTKGQQGWKLMNEGKKDSMGLERQARVWSFGGQQDHILEAGFCAKYKGKGQHNLFF